MKQAEPTRDEALVPVAAEETRPADAGWRRIPLPGAADDAWTAGALQRRVDARTPLALAVKLLSIDPTRDASTGELFFELGRDERTQNLSRRGMCVRCSRPPAVGARLLLQLRLPGGASVDVIGQARWTRVEFERGAFGARAFARVGVELLGGAPGVLERYDRALARLGAAPEDENPAVASPGGRR